MANKKALSFLGFAWFCFLIGAGYGDWKGRGFPPQAV